MASIIASRLNRTCRLTAVPANRELSSKKSQPGNEFLPRASGRLSPMSSVPLTPPRKPMARQSFLRRHSLSLLSITILVVWIVLYRVSDQHTHSGSFFGNAIADWSGVVVTVLATKFLYERGSAESRRPPRERSPFLQLIVDHSLTIFLVLTGTGWLALYLAMDSESKWGQVVGNVVSEWTQILALVLMTKKLIEAHSKESS